MSVLDYGDAMYMHESSQSWHALDPVYHGALRFITLLKPSLIIVSCMLGLDGLLCPSKS